MKFTKTVLPFVESNNQAKVFLLIKNTFFACLTVKTIEKTNHLKENQKQKNEKLVPNEYKQKGKKK